MISDRLPMRKRILLAIRQQGPARGQHELGQRVLGDRATFGDWNVFTGTVRSMLIEPAELIETKVQLPGTGHECIPVFEYVYTLLATETRV